MNEQKNNAPEQAKPEKKLSRTTLTFYIVGLFSVAIALILISYVAQARADRQVENLSSQLNEQQTVAQGATQKVADLQQQFDLQSSALESVRSTLGTEQAKTDVVGATQNLRDREQMLEMLVPASHTEHQARALRSSPSTARAAVRGRAQRGLHAHCTGSPPRDAAP